MPIRDHLYFLYSASDTESDDEEEYSEVDDDLWVNEQELMFFEDIAYGPFLTFEYKMPRTYHWDNPPKKYNVVKLFKKYLDDNTLHRMYRTRVIGQGTMRLTNSDIETLFRFAKRWCLIHKTKCVDWVAYCIVQFSCI